MNKKDYENKIYKLTQEILDDEILIEIKKQRREEIKRQLKLNIKEQTKKDLERELSFIDTDEKIKKLVKYNHSKNFLMDIEPNEKVVLVMGINPGGGSEIIKHSEITNDSILFIKGEDLEDEEKNSLKIFNKCYVFTHGYHKANYEIFKKINARAHWAKDNYLSEDEICKIVKNSAEYNGIDFKSLDIKKISQAIENMQKNERDQNNGPYVMFRGFNLV